MTRRLYALPLLLALGLVACGPMKLGAPPCSPSPNFATEVLDATNAVRAQHDVPALDWNPGLADKAHTWAGHMAATNDPRHSSWPHENLVGRWPCNTATELVAAWMQSPDHSHRILEDAYDSLGVGWTVDARGLWAVQQFL